MSFEADLKSHLQSDSSISDIVADRIHPLVLSENTALSAITYTLVFGDLQNSLDGHTSGLTRITLQLDCWSATFLRVITLAAAVKTRMDTAAATFTSIITSYPAFDDYEPDTKRFRRSIEVACWFKE